MSGSEKKKTANRNTSDISSVTRVVSKFHFVVVHNKEM